MPESENPYMEDLEGALSPFYEVVNKRPTKNGVINLFRYLFKADIFYFNWIENIPIRRFGKFQFVVFLLFLIIAKWLNKKILWTLHNKKSHETENYKWTDLLYRLMFKHADIIITHSSTGITYTENKFPKYSGKVSFIHHPVKRLFPLQPACKKDYDILIWGTIWPYKGIVEFLEFIDKNAHYKRYKILLLGQCPDSNYKKQIDKYLTRNVIHFNSFYDIHEVAKFASISKFVLFTYRPESILSSASLMDSIGMGSLVIGPCVGAFKDLNYLSFVYTYHTFDDIFKIIENEKSFSIVSYEELQEFCNQNNWLTLGSKLKNLISAKLSV